jgi:chromosome segregation protein
MRLTTIKLSGFKSFVDPTVLHLPANMTGIVGPNGCGKSNIIDAVRWVMGESAASRLRGDSLTDVIFSGSGGRKPVSQALVELVFDNSEGALGGEYASYAEISVKRTVSRDAVSNYYLNGTRCRRRDITELFLGTGLGPRSYSIIEQGMISQVIEARPEELRTYLEEAAGISKYKERRRETETRIRHTRENMERLDDLRGEVDKQIEHLRKQARQAEQYQSLQVKARETDAQIKALEYRDIERQLSSLREVLGREQTALEALLAEQRRAEAEIERCRTGHGEASEHLSRVQAESYRVSGEIARLEQQMQHQRELRQRLLRASEESTSALAELDAHIQSDSEQWQALTSAASESEPRLIELAERDQACQDALHAAEAALADWQARWDAHAREQAESVRSADVERTRIDYLERQALDAERRRDQLARERGELDLDALRSALTEIQQQHGEQRQRLDQLTAAVEEKKRHHAGLQERQRGAQGELAETRKQHQAARGRLASLEALQQAALGQESDAARGWLARQGLADAARLGGLLEVEAGWESAVETVLGTLLEAVVLDDVGSVLAELPGFDTGRLALVEGGGPDFQAPADSLAARVRGPHAVRRLLAGVRTVESLESAMATRSALSEGEALVTRSGEWLAHGWLRVVRAGEAQHGALAREREIHALREQLDGFARREAELEQALAELCSALSQADQAREDAQRDLYLAHRNVSELAGQIQSRQGRCDTAQNRIAAIERDLDQLAQSLATAQNGARESRTGLEVTVARMSELEARRGQLDAERQRLSAARDQARAAARESHDAAHHLALSVQSQRVRVDALAQALERMRAQREQLLARQAELAGQLADGDAPVQALESERQASLDQRVVVEKSLAEARSAVAGIEEEIRGHEHTRQQRDQQALAQREKLSERRMKEQAFTLRAAQLAEGIAADGQVLEDVINTLPEQADLAAWRQTLTDLEARMRRLEPVNLAAIQEFEEQSRRKEYLDAQNADLSSALETLETAIRKIDRETRGRFKDTFDRVNAGMQELYPRLFGGGHAYLELTGEDLLDAGVAIMARPPGKRVSNISLLSGGEKALTAVSLVFAIFRLNPAPFCLLDEVDAPLDEANVSRFCALVREMSEQVQFLIVTHNKTTMEAAHQLSGVTMREPGVSRLVSVDMAEATRMVGAA